MNALSIKILLDVAIEGGLVYLHVDKTQEECDYPVLDYLNKHQVVPHGVITRDYESLRGKGTLSIVLEAAEDPTNTLLLIATEGLERLSHISVKDLLTTLNNVGKEKKILLINFKHNL